MTYQDALNPQVFPLTCKRASEISTPRPKEPLAQSEVRRSPRIQQLNKGLKNNRCLEKNCLAFIVSPPSVPTSVIKNLPTAFCKVAASKLTDDRFTAKAKSTTPGARKTIRKKAGQVLVKLARWASRTRSLLICLARPCS